MRLAFVTWCLAAWWVAVGARPAEQAGRHAARPDVSLFAHSEDCQACHNNLTSPNGEDVSIGVSWRSTMMANSARDPYWQASVRREVLDHPVHAGDIQDECGGCHMPMATQIARAHGGKGEVFTHLTPRRGQDTALQRLAADGVSCTVCHQISPDGLGTDGRVNGRFGVTPPSATGVRRVFGPFEADAGRRMIMRSVTGYEQVQAPHVRESALCASCHTLITTALGDNGEAIGSLPEQMNFQEWQHSAFPAEQKGCQSCHMPRVAGPVRVASVLGDLRDGLSRHAFIGGNAQMLRILNRFRGELGVAAEPRELEATAAATIRQLQQETATVSIDAVSTGEGRVAFDVVVANLTGHKFPTGYPSRRAWLHVVVTDGAGMRVFESGAERSDGSIAGNDGDADPQGFEPHHDTITRGDQVQIYEPILGDRGGAPTTGLLTATQYLKDNRLLPRGFDKDTADARIAVWGDARHDRNFTAAGDRVRYDVEPRGTGPFTVDVELRYQSIGYRWAHNLRTYHAPEPRRFTEYYETSAPDSSVLVGRDGARVGARR
jgi:hypothetical protein